LKPLTHSLAQANPSLSLHTQGRTQLLRRVPFRFWPPMASIPDLTAAMWRKYSELDDAITATMIDVQAFARDHREARADLKTLSHQLVDLGGILDLWQHDAADDDDLSDVTLAAFPQIERVLAHCFEVLQDLERLLQENKQSSTWSAPVQKEIDGIFKQIDAYALSLNVTREMACLRRRKPDFQPAQQRVRSASPRVAQTEFEQLVFARAARSARAIPTTHVNSAAVSRDATLVAGATSITEVTVYHLDSGKKFASLILASDNYLTEFVHGSNAPAVFGAKEGVTFAKLKPKDVRCIWRPAFTPQEGKQVAWAFSPSRNQFAFAHSSGVIQIFSSLTARWRLTRGPNQAVVAFSWDSRARVLEVRNVEGAVTERISAEIERISLLDLEARSTLDLRVAMSSRLREPGSGNRASPLFDLDTGRCGFMDSAVKGRCVREFSVDGRYMITKTDKAEGLSAQVHIWEINMPG
ncbi:Uncharacterized protein TPAR_00563, partial [Tolypocladium paradoxum]